MTGIECCAAFVAVPVDSSFDNLLGHDDIVSSIYSLSQSRMNLLSI